MSGASWLVGTGGDHAGGVVGMRWRGGRGFAVVAVFGYGLWLVLVMVAPACFVSACLEAMPWRWW